MSANWLKVPDNQVPTNPRPGTCFNDTKSLSDTYINFIKKHTLVDESVRALLIDVFNAAQPGVGRVQVLGSKKFLLLQTF